MTHERDLLLWEKDTTRASGASGPSGGVILRRSPGRFSLQGNPIGNRSKSDSLTSDEFEFVVVCCSWPVTQEVLAEVRSRAERAIDWERVRTLAERHRVVGHVQRTVTEAGIVVPAPYVSRFEESARWIAEQNLRLVSEGSRLQKQLESAGIPVLTLKGAPLAQRVYGTIAFKDGRDIDLLVRPADVLTALELLESNGYSFVNPARQMTQAQRRAFVERGFEMTLSNAAKRVRVDLHWRLSENCWLISEVDAFAAPQTITFGGRSIRTLSDRDLFVYLCVHGAKHNWFRLKWLADLNALLTSLSQADVADLYAYSRVHGADLCAAQALLLCYRIFGLALPELLRGQLVRNRRAQQLVSFATRSIMEPGSAAKSRNMLLRQVRSAAQRFLLGRGVRFLASECVISFTGHADILRWPLPAGLSFLYWLVRIPSWLLRRIRRFS